ncbi:AraC family transcriptional regulator [Thioclava sp. GXIMD4216]|uniref:helix-turn-helix transcriptional regulator n=1 Tax=Thioclava sp. GXIMD4216 TaxID=3131929 RepID=UPI0030CD3375
MAIFSARPFSATGRSLPIDPPDVRSPPLSGTSSAPPPYRLEPIAHLSQAGRWRMEALRALSEPCLYWITRGQGRVTIGGIQRGYGAHNALYLPAGIMHGLEISNTTQGLALFLGQDHDPSFPAHPHHLRIRDLQDQSELTGLLDNLGRETCSTRPAAPRAAQHYLGLLSVWLERQIALSPRDDLRGKATRQLVNRFTALVERDFRATQSVSDYAMKLRVTPTHLSRACRDACGRPASDLLQERRLYEARKLLHDTDMPIKDIAARLGFRSQTYFARSFHSQTGSTPSHFRQTRP